MRSVVVDETQLRELPASPVNWIQRLAGAVAYMATDDFAAECGVTDARAVLSGFGVGLIVLAGVAGALISAVLR